MYIVVRLREKEVGRDEGTQQEVSFSIYQISVIENAVSMTHHLLLRLCRNSIERYRKKNVSQVRREFFILFGISFFKKDKKKFSVNSESKHTHTSK